MIMNLSNKFRGCLVGGLLGDCLGAPFEGETRSSRSVLNSYFKKLADPNVRGMFDIYSLLYCSSCYLIIYYVISFVTINYP